MSDQSHTAMKKLIRKNMKDVMLSLSETTILSQSDQITRRLISHPSYLLAKTVCIYLSMTREVQTWDILKSAFSMNKRVIVPKVVGPQSWDLLLLEVKSLEDINSFPKKSWGIPEPSSTSPDDDMSQIGLIDTIIVPGKLYDTLMFNKLKFILKVSTLLPCEGVAFDSKCGRVGHGKGYYDCCIDRVSKGNLNNGRTVPVLIGVAFDEQIIDSVPIDPHDKILDCVITSSQIYTSQN